MDSTFSKFRSGVSDDLEVQVARLQKEVRTLRKALGKRGAAVYGDTRDTASDLYDEITGRVVDALPHIRKQSRVMQRAAADHPLTTALVGVAMIGLLVGLLTRR